MKAVYQGEARELEGPNGVRIRLRKREVIEGPLAAWLLERFPAEFKAAPSPPRLTEDTPAGSYVTKG